MTHSLPIPEAARAPWPAVHEPVRARDLAENQLPENTIDAVTSRPLIAAGVGIGSAAVVAALLYWRKRTSEG